MADAKRRKRKLEGKTMRDYFPHPREILEKVYRPWYDKAVYRIRRDREARRKLREAEERFMKDLVHDRITALEEGTLSPGPWFDGFRRVMTNCLKEHEFRPSLSAEEVSQEKRYLLDVDDYVNKLLFAQMRKYYVDPLHPTPESLRKLAKGVVEEVRKTLGDEVAAMLEGWLESKIPDKKS